LFIKDVAAKGSLTQILIAYYLATAPVKDLLKPARCYRVQKFD